MRPRLKFMAALDVAPRPDAGRVVVDLLEVTFLGSAGRAGLISITQKAREHGTPLPVVVATQPAVPRTIQVSALDTVLMISASVDEALTR